MSERLAGEAPEDAAPPRKRGNPFARVLARAANVLLPPLCLGCREAVQGHGGLCPDCWARVDFIEPPLCDRLGIPLPYSAGDGEVLVSAGALADPPVWDRARAAARYDRVMRDMVLGFKFRDRHEALALLAGWLVHAGRDILPGADLIVPVPLHRFRLWSRRFNQAALLAGAVSARTGIPADRFLLARHKPTAHQVGLTAEQRKSNVAGAFSVARERRGRISGKALVLIDDVITTGATANACARVLKRAGAARVDVLALARVVDPAQPAL